MVTTAADLIAQTRDDYLLNGQTEARNKLSADYTAGGTTLSFQFPLQKIQAGATVTIGQNTFYVWAPDSGSNVATVQGGYQDSTDADADAGDEVTINPRFPEARIFRAINQEIQALSSPRTGLFQAKRVELTYLNSDIGYDLTGVTSVTSIIEVRYDIASTGRSPRLLPSQWRLERNYDVADSPSTFSLKVFEGGGVGQTLTVLYRTGFGTFDAITDTTEDAGLPDSLLDIVCMGAALRLLVGREVRRNDLAAQGDTRRPTEVPAGAVANSWRGLAALRQQRIGEEAARLAAQYPVSR